MHRCDLYRLHASLVVSDAMFQTMQFFLSCYCEFLTEMHSSDEVDFANFINDCDRKLRSGRFLCMKTPEIA